MVPLADHHHYGEGPPADAVPEEEPMLGAMTHGSAQPGTLEAADALEQEQEQDGGLNHSAAGICEPSARGLVLDAHLGAM